MHHEINRYAQLIGYLYFPETQNLGISISPIVNCLKSNQLKIKLKKQMSYQFFSCTYPILICAETFNDSMRKEVYLNFHKLDWQAQPTFISSSILLSEVKKRLKDSTERIKYSRKYMLDNVQVCKTVFSSSIGVSFSRIDYILKNKAKTGTASPDRRGKHSPANKTPIKVKANAFKFPEKFPKYKSH